MDNDFYQTLDNGITCIDTGYGRPKLAACYLLEAEDKLAFIETGTAHTLPRALDLLSQKGYKPEQVAYVIPTHVHLDHAGGVGAMMEAFPNAELVVHPRGARHMIDPAKLIAGVKAVYGEDGYKQHFGQLLPVAEERVIEAPDGFQLDLGNRKLLFIDTPGHAKHHFCVYDDLSKGIFTGDTFGLSYREFDTAAGPFLFATTTPVQFQPEAWENTIDRLMALQPKTFFMTHYSAIPASEALAERLRQSIGYFVKLALAAPEADRKAYIEAKMLKSLLAELREHGCELDEATCTDLLAGDIDLNTQGLIVWLEQQKK